MSDGKARSPAAPVPLMLAGVLTGVLAGVLVGAPLDAQQGSVEAEAGVSHAQPPSGFDLPSATYGLLGLRLTYGEAERGWLWGTAYGGLATSADAGDWGSLAVGGEVWEGDRPGLQAGLGGRASAFTVGDPDQFRAATGALFPQVRYSEGPLSFRLRGLGGAGTSEVEITRPGFETGTVSTDLWYVGAEPGVSFRTESGELTGTLAYLDARAGVYRRAGLSYSGRDDDVGWSAGLELWDTPAGSEVAVRVSLDLTLEGPWSAHLGGGRSDPDPLLESPPSWQGTGTVGYRLTDLAPAAPVPLTEISGTGPRKSVRIRLEARDAERVVLLGDFTGWEPVPLERVDGHWSATVRVEPGVYHFGFRVDGEWLVPEHASGQVNDDWGRTNATLVVPGT